MPAQRMIVQCGQRVPGGPRAQEAGSRKRGFFVISLRLPHKSGGLFFRIFQETVADRKRPRLLCRAMLGARAKSLLL